VKVALIHPASPFLVDQAVHPPLGLWYLGAALKEAGHEVTYVDRGLDDTLPTDADLWGLTGTTAQLEDMAAVLKDATAPVIAGGPHATLDPDGILALGATAVVCGEGERLFPALLADGLPEPGAIAHAARITDLDALPLPDRSQAGRYHYAITDRQGVARRATTAITSRGCPHRCAFCSHGLWQRRYTARGAASVIAEARAIRDMGFEAVHFYDDSLAIDRRRLFAICEGLRHLGIVWRAFVRADQMTSGRLAAMARSGCVEVGMGVESGSNAVLAAIHKDETAEQMAQTIGWAHRVGIRVKAFLIVGLPGESWATIDETAAFLAQTRPDDLDVTVLQLMPGSPLHEAPAAYGLTPMGAATWYKGRRGEYEAHHRTAAMTPGELLAARDYLEARFKPQAVAA